MMVALHPHDRLARRRVAMPLCQRWHTMIADSLDVPHCQELGEVQRMHAVLLEKAGALRAEVCIIDSCICAELAAPRSHLCGMHAQFVRTLSLVHAVHSVVSIAWFLRALAECKCSCRPTLRPESPASHRQLGTGLYSDAVSAHVAAPVTAQPAAELALLPSPGRLSDRFP